MLHLLRASIAVLIAGCAAEGSDFSLSFTFRGDVCGGLDLLSRQRVAKIEYQVYGPADPMTPIHEGSVPCSDQPLMLTLDPVKHRVVVGGIGDDGNRCWDTGPSGVVIAPTAEGVTVDVPQVCVLNDAARLSVDVVGPGDVISEPGGIDCPSVSCVGVYEKFAGVRLTARPRPGAEFSHWETCGYQQPSVTVAVFSTRECRAIFVDPLRSDWSPAISVSGPTFGSDWSAAIEDGGPVVVYAEGTGSIGLSRSASLPQAASDWDSGALLTAAEGGAVASPEIAVDANRTWITAGFSSDDSCGIAVMSRIARGDPFAVAHEIPVASPPCTAERAHALAPVGEGALVLATVNDTSIVAHLIDGASPISAAIFDSPSAGALRGISDMVTVDGRPALAFSLFDREIEQGEVWVAVAKTARPMSRADWVTHPIYSSNRTPEAPAMIVDGTRFAVTFGTVEGLGRDTEQRSQHLAMSGDLDPQTDADWLLVLVDEARGGPSSLMRHGWDLVIAYGHTDADSGVHSMVVASSEESSPSGPESFSAHTIDQTVFLSRPLLLGIARMIGILYPQGPSNPLVFRSTAEL